MKVLVLSCSTGEGHNSAGNAVIEYFSSKNISCNMINAFNFVSDVLSEFLSRGHVFAYRNIPRIFGVGYKIEEKYPPKSFYKKMSKGASALYEYIKKGGYDVVICSHIFAAMMLTECKRQFKCGAASYLIVTDYTCSPGVNLLDMDAYFIPHKQLTDDFTAKGIPVGRLVASGIPVSQKFFSGKTKADSRRELGLEQDSDVILLGGGSMGCGPMYELTRRLLDTIHYSCQLCVICASNRRLYSELQALTKDKRLVLTEFTPKMFDYMNSADVYITKPGGLSTTEAVSLGLPLVFIDAVPGCESYNLSFMTENGCAVTAKDADLITELVCDILKDKESARLKFLENRKNIISNGAENIYNYVLSKYHGGESLV